VYDVESTMAGRTAMPRGKRREFVLATEFGEGGNEEGGWRVRVYTKELRLGEMT
jgi:hypothetical protein